MKQVFAIGSLVVLALAGAPFDAAPFVPQGKQGERQEGGQSDPFAGTWKLNLAKSKYNAGTPPKSEVRTYEVVPSDPSAKLRVSNPAESEGRRYETQGDGEKLTVHGVAADGSPVEWGYTVRFDGKYYPITGNGPGGADAIAVKRINASRVEATLAKGGKAIETASRIVSEDGKTMTATAWVLDATPSATLRTSGQPIFVIVYDKQ